MIDAIDLTDLFPMNPSRTNRISTLGHPAIAHHSCGAWFLSRLSRASCCRRISAHRITLSHRCVELGVLQPAEKIKQIPSLRVGVVFALRTVSATAQVAGSPGVAQALLASTQNQLLGGAMTIEVESFYPLDELVVCLIDKKDIYL